MPNIHGINEFRNNNNNQNAMDPMTNDVNIELLNILKKNTNPDKENYVTMIKNNYCPNFKFFKTSLIWAYIMLIVFILEVIFDEIIYVNKPNFFLAIDHNGVIFRNLVFKRNKLFTYEIYTLITNLFVSQYFLDIFGNIFMIILFGLMVEQLMSKISFLLILFLTSVLGNFFCLLVYDNKIKTTGFSSLGLFGGLLGLVIFEWKELQKAKLFRRILLFQIFFALILSMLLNRLILTKFIDLIIGTSLGMFLTENSNNISKIIGNNEVKNRKYKKKVKLIGLITFILISVTITSLIFLFDSLI